MKAGRDRYTLPDIADAMHAHIKVSELISFPTRRMACTPRTVVRSFRRFAISRHGAAKTDRPEASWDPACEWRAIATLHDVVDYYDRGGNANPTLDPEIHALQLTPGERRALIAFLESLTGTVFDR